MFCGTIEFILSLSDNISNFLHLWYSEESLVERSRSVSSADDGKDMILESERVTALQEGNPRSTNV